jgi:6-phosphogluconolactonase
MRSPVALYSGVGEVLTHYEVDTESAILIERNAVRLPANVQYAWPHPSKKYLYVISSNRGSAPEADMHHLSVFTIDPLSGALAEYGEPFPLRSRPIHVSLDATGAYALVAYNDPSGVSVHRINDRGGIEEEIPPKDRIDCGIFAHQVVTMPSNKAVVVVARGNSAVGARQEDPGALKVFKFCSGLMTEMMSIAPDGGYGFGPRHIDFHPTQPWMYVSLERQSKLSMFRMRSDILESPAAFVRETLADPQEVKPRQLAGAIHVHPNGRFVYLANRADWTVDFEGVPIFGGGENSIVGYAINQATGEPTLIQRVDPRSMHVRTFALDPSGHMLVAAGMKPLTVRDETTFTTVHAGLSVFNVADNGQLDFVRKYDIDTEGKMLFWMGMVGLG